MDPIQKHITTTERMMTNRRNTRSMEKMRLYMIKIESLVDDVMVKYKTVVAQLSLVYKTSAGV